MSRKTSTVFLLGCITLALQGCATLSKEECLYADWYQIGLEDGNRGKDPLTLGRHRKACAKAGVTPDREAYEQGHTQGLLRYCTYDNGLLLGNVGRSRPEYCPAPTLAEFNLGYEHGYERYQQNRVIHQLESQIDSLNHSIEDNHHQIEHLEAVLISDQTTGEQREEALEELRAIEDENVELINAVSDIRESLQSEQRFLDELIYEQQSAR